MATRRKTVVVGDEIIASSNNKYKGSQLLKMAKYNNRVARILIKPDESYAFEEADGLISELMERKG